MDKTPSFKAIVDELTNQNLGSDNQTSHLLKPITKDVHVKKAKEIKMQIANLEAFLLKNKPAHNYLSTKKTMIESDREKVDQMAESEISSCTNFIQEFQKEIQALSESWQKKEHYQNIIQSLGQYLKNVSKIYSEAKAEESRVSGVKRVLDTYKLSKLAPKRSKSKENREYKSTGASLDGSVDLFAPAPVYENKLSAYDMQMFDQENEHLCNESSSISDEVRQMECKIVNVAELKELSTEKVLQEEQDIKRISKTVVGSTENNNKII